MDGKLIAIIVGCVIADLVVILTAGNIFKKKNDSRKIFGRKRQPIITLRGSILVLFLLVGNAGTIWLYYDDKQEREHDTQNHIIQVAKRDSTDSVAKIWLDTSLHSQGLKIDQLTGKIVKTNIQDKLFQLGPSPDFGFCAGPNSIEVKQVDKLSDSFYVKLCCNEAKASGIYIKSKVVGEYDKGDFRILPNMYKDNGARMNASKGAIMSWDFFVRYTENHPRRIHFLLTGYYYNLDRTKRFGIDELFYYDFTNGNIGFLADPVAKEIRTLIKKHPEMY